MNKYTAFLRGINVGGNKLIKMDDLKKAFESAGFKNIKTILASGNVIFESGKKSAEVISKTIEEMLHKTFSHKISVIVRSIEDLQKLSEVDPFKYIEVTKDTRLYVSFVNGMPELKLKLPYESDDKCLRILGIKQNTVCSVIIVSPQSNTIDLMNFLDKELGKNVTTRNWNTVMRILKAAKLS